MNPHQLSIIIQVNSFTQLQSIRSLIGVLWSTGDVYPLVSTEILRLVCVYSNSHNVTRVAQRCVGPRYVCSVLHAHAQFCRFDKADATADVQWHCNHQPPLWYHYFPAQNSLGADILVYWIGKIVQTCAPSGSGTLYFLCARQAPYPLGQALRYSEIRWPDSAFYSPPRPLSTVIRQWAVGWDSVFHELLLTKVDNFCDFLFTALDNKALPK